MSGFFFRPHQNFRSLAKKTSALLERATPEVFSSFAVGVYLNGRRYFATEGADLQSLFDLASLTKVIATTTLFAIAEEKKIMALTDKVKKYFPSFSDERVTLSHLLNHSSGLPAWLPLHNAFHDQNGLGDFDPTITPRQARSHYENEIIKSHAPEKFESETLYSDLGFMLAGWALEKASQQPIDALFQEWVALPARTRSLQYLPISPNVVPTEKCPWRKHVLRGEVHDDNTYVLGGVAGHAGLFGNVGDVLEVGRFWLDAFHESRAEVLSPESAKKYFTVTHVKNSVRVLGWDGVSPPTPSSVSSTGRYFSRYSRGHLGFTGTSLWIDPEKNLIVTLLTNRVYPTRQNEKIKAFRPEFHNTLCEELGFTKMDFEETPRYT